MRIGIGQRPMDRNASATARQDERAKRTDKQQLARLDKLLGKGVGAKRERARLNERIAKAAAPTT